MTDTRVFAVGGMERSGSIAPATEYVQKLMTNLVISNIVTDEEDGRAKLGV